MPDTHVSQLGARLQIATTLARLDQIVRIPTVTFWNRLEGRPRSDKLHLSLQAQVRDPLWMLSRQWQLGEFEGADSGVPVQASLLTETRAVISATFGRSSPEAYENDVPLETSVEGEPIELDLLMGLYIGRRWIRLLRDAFGAMAPIVVDFTHAYRVRIPGDPLGSLLVGTHAQEWQLRRTLEGRALDGTILVNDLRASVRDAEPPSDAFSRRFAAEGLTLPAAARTTLDTLAETLSAWLEGPTGLFKVSPAAAWQEPRLEYRFSVGIAQTDGTETVLAADQYPGGRLDWYSFDVDSSRPTDTGAPAAERKCVPFLPTPVRFAGMPNVRWWEFEDRHVGFGLTTAKKTDLVKMLLAEFGLVFANDWFILPFTAPVGRLIETIGIRVTDNFGRHTLIEPTVTRHQERQLAGRWNMWGLRHRGTTAGIDARLFLAPALPRSIESRPLEEVLFLRDETANLVWAVEQVIPSALGGGRDARAAGQLLRQAIMKAAAGEPDDGPEPAEAARDVPPLVYQLMNSVPEHWIPFVSVQLTGEPTARVVLQGAMPRIPPIEPATDGGSPILAHNAVLPRGRILSRDPVAHANIIYEEEVLRGGAIVRRTVQQTRWHDGSVHTWAGRAKRTGRGEGASGLVFDRVTPALRE